MATRIMEGDEKVEVKPKEKRARRKKDLVEEEQADLIHEHKEAIAVFIKTPTWRQTICLRELKESTRELLAGTDVVMQNDVFTKALKLVEAEILSDENMGESDKNDMGKRLSAIKLVFGLVKPRLVMSWVRRDTAAV